MANTTERRRNGLERPWHPFQIATWILFPIVLVHYFAFLLQIMWDILVVKTVITIIFCIFAVSSVVSGYITVKIDPADDALDRHENEPSALTPHDPSDGYCYICELHVNPTSKHCRFCDKCVVRFDHHCKWLNTCIGEKNYRYFLLTVVSVALLTSTSAALSTTLLIQSYISPNQFENNFSRDNQGGTQADIFVGLEGARILLIFSVVLFLPLVLMVYQLGGFHLMLICKQQTTYDFIVSQQKNQREKEAQRSQRKQAAKQARESAAVGVSGGSASNGSPSEDTKKNASQSTGKKGGANGGGNYLPLEVANIREESDV